MGHDYRSKRRVSLRRLKGKIILSLLPTYDLDGTKAGAQPVTIARKFRAENKINPPAVIRVVRNSYTTDEFFWSENGMFALRYAEFNWANFPALLRICRSEEFLEKLNEERKNMHDTVLDIEDYFPQYSYT